MATSRCGWVVLSFVLGLSWVGLEPAIRAAATGTTTNDVIARIRDEGLNHSQVMETLSYLTDVIGGRLTGSPNFKRSAEWTREKLESWGLTQAHLESWGPFGRGWSLKRFSAQIIEPQAFPLIAQPKAWTPGLNGPLTAEVVLVDAKTQGELDQYHDRLKGAIVLVSSPRDLKAWFEAPGQRLNDAELLRLANTASGGRSSTVRSSTNSPAGERRFSSRTNAAERSRSDGTNAPARTNSPTARTLSSADRLAYAAKAGAALIVSGSGEGDGGAIFVASASVPSPAGRETNAAARGRPPSPWQTNSPPIPPQIALASEDYNRLARMIRQGEKLKMAVELQTQFHDDDLLGYNVVAEIPGGEFKDELVMLGGHLDSWHAGTGATDNGAGVAVALEAVRILQALQLRPRRTIRVGLWGGEEEGLLGSKAYVAKHFGYYTNVTNVVTARSPKDERGAGPESVAKSTNAPPKTTRKLIRQRDYDRFSVYFNLDNGTGKIRGVYLQGNEEARPLFRRWLEPFRDLGADTLSSGNTGGTDHISFDAIGLPGFQFIQDPVEYWTRTHHSSMDVFDRIQADDLKQASVIMAALVYDAAMMDGKMVRKRNEPATQP